MKTPMRTCRAMLALAGAAVLGGCAQDAAPDTLARPARTVRRESATPELDAAYDDRLDAMCLTPLPYPVADAASGPAIWDQPIPPTIWQIWLGKNQSPHQANMDAWRAYAQRFGLDYQVITEADLPGLLSFADASFVDIFQHLHDHHEYRGASDMLRYLLLARFGGTYADVDVRTPKFLGEEVPLRAIMPQRGLVVVSDGSPVEWGTGGLHLLNAVLASAPGHPTLMGLVRQLPDNVRCVLRSGDANPVLMTGPAPLNVLLTGPATVVPVLFWESLGVADPEWF